MVPARIYIYKVTPTPIPLRPPFPPRRKLTPTPFTENLLRPPFAGGASQRRVVDLSTERGEAPGRRPRVVVEHDVARKRMSVTEDALERIAFVDAIRARERV